MHTQAAPKHVNFDHFAHVTVDTGHTSAADSNSVSAQVRAHFAPLINSALASGKPVAVPLVAPNAFMTICEEDGAYRTCLLAREVDTFVPVVTFGVSLTPIGGSLLWQRLNSGLLLEPVSRTRQPESPWIAVRFEFAVFRHLDIVASAGEFERSITWTLATHVARSFDRPPISGEQHVATTQAAPVSRVQPVPAWDGAVFNCHKDCGPTLTLYFSSPSDEEISGIRRGEARFAIARHRDVSFMLLKFGGLDWMDAPFHAGLYAAELRGMPREWRPGTRLALAVVIVDRDTGQKCGARLLSLSPHFWNTLAAQVARQASSPISQESYDSEIDDAYRAYATPRAMLKHALATSKAGN